MRLAAAGLVSFVLVLESAIGQPVSTREAQAGPPAVTSDTILNSIDALTTIRMGARTAWVTSPTSPVSTGSTLSIGMVMEEPVPQPTGANTAEALAATRPTMAIDIDGDRLAATPYVPAVADRYIRSAVVFTLKKPIDKSFDVLLLAADGTTVFRGALPRFSSQSWGAEPGRYRLPRFGQSGGPVEVAGPFDGDPSTTEVTVGGRRVNVLAETANRTWFFSPADLVGPFELRVKDGAADATGNYRALGVQLAAPKTNLSDGEKVDVTMTVSGLQGLGEDAPLLLEKAGNVQMQGGDTQTVRIRPDAVKNGLFSLSRTMTGLTTGTFALRATVVDPPRRPRVVRIDQKARVNGYDARGEGQSLELELENVQDPSTGLVLSGDHSLETRCRLDAPPVLTRLSLNKGKGKVKAPCTTLLTPRILILGE